MVDSLVMMLLVPGTFPGCQCDASAVHQMTTGDAAREPEENICPNTFALVIPLVVASSPTKRWRAFLHAGGLS
jgi:hypothetical protein